MAEQKMRAEQWFPIVTQSYCLETKTHYTGFQT